MRSSKSLLTALLLSTALSGFAQEADNTLNKAVSFGIKGGVNFANIAGSNYNGPDSRTSFHAGLLMEVPVSDMFSIQAEALYSGQGFEFDQQGTLENEHVEYQLDYINVPVLAKIYLTKGLAIEAGPQVGFKINEEIDTNPNNNAGDTNVNEAESIDFSIAGGLSFQTEMGLFATGRYSYGLTDVVKNVDGKNTVFSIGIGYKF